jgi:hypothetical protein
VREFHLIGDSHIGCISRAYRQQLKADPQLPYRLTSHSLGGGGVAYDLAMNDHTGRPVPNPLLRMALAAAKGQAAKAAEGEVEAVICVGGYITSVYTWDTRVCREFDLLSSEQDTLDARATFVCASLVRESLKAHYANWARGLALACDGLPLPVRLVSPPPPYRSGSAIVQGMALKRGLPKNKMPQPMAEGVRLKVWKLSCETLQELAADIGLPYMPPPPGTTDDDGFLAPECYGDGFHANERYGKRVLDSLA